MVRDELLNLLSKNKSYISINEDESTMSYKIKIELESKELNMFTKDNLKMFINKLKIKGSFTINIEVENSDTLCLIKKIDDISSELDNLYEDIPQTNKIIVFIMAINKSNSQGKIKVYSAKAFKNTLLNLSYEKLIEFFSLCIKNNKTCFIIPDISNNIFSESFRITNDDTNYNNKEIDKNYRKQILEYSNIYCISQGFNKNISIPDDFYVEDKGEYNFLNLLFNKLLFITSLMNISNYYKLTSNNFYFKIVGYKTIEYNLDLKIFFNNKDSSTYVNTYYKIYKWIYKDKNIEEKIEMARNLITLYIKNDTLKIDSNIIKSLNSALKIYLKENINKYIETRNTIVKEIKNLTSKTDGIIKSFINNFKHNLLAQFTFITTIILMNIISSNSINKLFSKEITIMIITFVFISILCATLNRFYIYRKEMERYEQFYNRIKECYDYLDPVDLNNILKNDKYFEEDKNYIRDEVNKYYQFWIMSQLVIILCLVVGCEIM